MTLNEYQESAVGFAVYPASMVIVYPTLGLAGEAGEVANQVKKIGRDDEGFITDSRYDKLVDELGDVLWYAAVLANDLGVDLEAVAALNIEKLEKRRQDDLLHGDKRKS